MNYYDNPQAAEAEHRALIAEGRRLDEAARVVKHGRAVIKRGPGWREVWVNGVLVGHAERVEMAWGYPAEWHYRTAGENSYATTLSADDVRDYAESDYRREQYARRPSDFA